MQKLAVTDGLAAKVGMQDALIATGIEYYYFSDPADLDPFFEAIGGGIHFDIGDIDPESDQKGYARLRDYVTETYGPLLPDPSLLTLDTRRQWFVQAGPSGMEATSTGDTRARVTSATSCSVPTRATS